jgi:hypothetical protein
MPADTYYNIAIGRLQGQFEVLASLDAKAATAIGFAAAVVPIVGAFLSTTTLPGIAIVFYTGALAAYLWLLLATYTAYSAQTWSQGPDLDALLEVSKKASNEDEVRAWAAEELTKAHSANQAAADLKRKNVNDALKALGLVGLLLTVAAIATILHHT